MDNVKINLYTALMLTLLGSCSPKQETRGNVDVDQLGVEVSVNANREYSYTDKKSGYYYGRTHEDNFGEWFAGWNIAKKRILSDYTLYADTIALLRKNAEKTMVYPDKLIRTYPQLTEEFSMVDNNTILFMGLSDIKSDSVGISINNGLVSDPVFENQVLYYKPKEANGVIAVASYKSVTNSFLKGRFMSPASSGGFILAYGDNKIKADSLIEKFRVSGVQMLASRKERLQNILMNNTPVHSNNDSLDKALSWLVLTTDQLVTEQQGKGIYAGLPWFNEYWGRDMFISMPGATLVTGQFDTSRDILRDFSQFQDKDSTSATWGRIPNRANLEGILYNTTDGTPRFVIEIEDYLKYSGDKEFLVEIYPSVVTSINASIKNYTDSSGFLTHADADTWMDVKRNGIPGSPRGNRANDIQALWYGQLMAGVEFAKAMNDQKNALEWESVAYKLKRNFEKDFSTGMKDNIADHLNTDGSRDMQVRPNQLYTFDLITDDAKKMRITRKLWEEIVYPWGVASLSQNDPDFHPYHENWNYYHKDDAYHNGTVWLWNNGIAMQRMIEMNQQDIAYQLFKNMNRQALVEGAVGSLSENADALPREGENWAKRSGTFLQAWSNAEQLRVWYQYFLGIRPDMIKGLITIEPKIPGEITDLTFKEILGTGAIKGFYKRNGSRAEYEYVLDGESAKVNFHLWPFLPIILDMESDSKLHVTRMGASLNVELTDAKGKVVFVKQFEPDPNQVQLMDEQNKFFEGTTFAKPYLQPDLKALKTYHKEPLTY
ncbi:MAG: amylo-alpha-1,6-glucosidase [Bacteroidales bacterium]